MTVKFDNKSIEDWGLMLSGYKASAPEQKRYTIEVPGRDGAIDYTDVFGEVRYKQRTVEITLVKADYADEWETLFHDIENELHGQIKKIKVGDEAYYWKGYCTVSCDKTNNLLTIKVTCTCDPYKYKDSVTTVTGTEPATITLTNSRMTAWVNVTTDAAIEIAVGDTKYSCSAGTHNNVFAISEGNTSITITGTANYTITYQEGVL